MSGLFGGGNGANKSTPEFSSLRISTATYGRPIPIIIGKARVATWVMWYGDFKAVQHEQSTGGKGGGQQSVNYTYTAAIAQGLCEGPINGTGTLWRGSEVIVPTTTSTQVLTRTETVAVGADGVAHLDGLGGVVTIADVHTGMNWQDRSTAYAPADYTASGTTLTFTNPWWFGGTATVTYTTSLTVMPVSELGQINATLYAGSYSQTAWPWLSTFNAAQALGYRGMAYLASPVFDLGNSSDMPNMGVEVDSVYGYSASVRDANPRDLLAQYLTNPAWGAMITPGSLGDWSSWSQYCVASGIFLSADYVEQEPAAGVVARIAAVTNSEVVATAGKIDLVPYADQAVTGNGVTWTPNLTAVCELTVDDWAAGSFKAQRKDPLQRYNHMRLKFRDRANQYNENVAEAKDDANISVNGLRDGAADVSAPEVKTMAVAQAAINLVQQRAQNIAARYSFKLKFNRAYLNLMDLVALTYAPLALSQKLARITKISEKGWWLDVECEEVPLGAASAITYPYQPVAGYTVPANTTPSSVVAPLIFEAPGQQAAGTGLALCVAVTGQAGDPDWGGAHVWLSTDGTNYRQVGTVNGGARYGTLLGGLAAGAGATAPVQLAGRGGQLLSATTADAAALASLVYLGTGEFAAYTTATLTGTNQYMLTLAQRGALGTAAAAASTGAVWARLDDAVFRTEDLSTTMVGTTVHIKCTSFNKYGGGEQSLGEAVAYTYTVGGVMVPTNTAVAAQATATATAAALAAATAPGAITRTQLETELGKTVDLVQPTSAASGLLNLQLTTLAQAVMQLGLKASGVDGVLRDAGIAVDPQSGTVKISGVEQTASALSTVNLTLSAHQAAINLRATTAYVDGQIAAAVLGGQVAVFTALDTRLTTAEVNISGLTSTVSSKADSTVVDAQGVRLTTAETSISGLTSTVATKAATTVTDGLNTRLGTAENTLSALGDQAASITDLKSGAYRLNNAADLAGVTDLQALMAVWQTSQNTNTALALAHEELTTKINGDVSAEAAQRLALQASTAAGIAAVQSTASATSSLVGGLSAQYTLKAQVVRPDGKVVLGSVGVAATANDTGSQSEILLAGDKISVVLSSDPAATTKPLLVAGTVNGSPSIGINGDLFIDGTLTVNKLNINDAKSAAGQQNAYVFSGGGSAVSAASGSIGLASFTSTGTVCQACVNGSLILYLNTTAAVNVVISGTLVATNVDTAAVVGVPIYGATRRCEGGIADLGGTLYQVPVNGAWQFTGSYRRSQGALGPGRSGTLPSPVEVANMLTAGNWALSVYFDLSAYLVSTGAAVAAISYVQGRFYGSCAAIPGALPVYVGSGGA